MKYSLLKTRKTSKDQKSFLHEVCKIAALKKLKMFKKNVGLTLTCPSGIFFRGVLQVFIGGKLPHRIALSTCKGCLFVWWTKYFLLRAPQGQLPKQKHSPNVVLGTNCSEKFPTFNGMKTFPNKVPTWDILRRIPSQIFSWMKIMWFHLIKSQRSLLLFVQWSCSVILFTIIL